MKSITVLFKKFSEKIKKHFEKKDFLNSKPKEVINDLEVQLAYKLKNIDYTIKELLSLEEYDLLRMLQHEKHLQNFFVFLKREISKRQLDIDLKKYPAFKDFEIKRNDKSNYANEFLGGKR